MQLTYAIPGVLFAITTVVYLHALFKFYGIVRAERPEWIDKKGLLSSFYTDLPRISDPNVGIAVIATAFSSRVQQLHEPKAEVYAKCIRVLLPTGLVLFASAVMAAAVGAP